MKHTLISVGTAYLDINFLHFPFDNGLMRHSEVVGDSYQLQLGGSALNFARMCDVLGMSSIFIGKIGEDLIGNSLLNLLKKTSILPAFIVSPAVQTNIAVHYVRPDGVSIMTSAGSANQSVQPDEVEKQLQIYLPKARYLYLGGCFKLKSLLPYYKDFIQHAKKKKLTIILDHGRINNKVTEKECEYVRELIPFVDYYLPSKDEFLSLWNVNTIRDGIFQIHKKSDAVIVVKDSQNGAIGFSKNTVTEVPAFPVSVLNTVGAGDSFNAGFIYALEHKESFKNQIVYGCATAAVKISSTDLPSHEKINYFLKAFSL